MPSCRSSLANARGFERGDLGARVVATSHCASATRFSDALVALHRERRRRRDLAGERERRAERVVVDVLHEPEAERLLGVDRAARRAGSRAPRPGRRAAPAARCCAALRWMPSLPPGIASRAPSAGDPQVARDRELHARADRGAVDRGDHRRRDGRRSRRAPPRTRAGTCRLAVVAVGVAKRVTRSAPAQNAVPAPVITTARSSRLRSRCAAQLRRTARAFSALRRSWRSIVASPTWPRASNWIIDASLRTRRSAR